MLCIDVVNGQKQQTQSKSQQLSIAYICLFIATWVLGLFDRIGSDISALVAEETVAGVFNQVLTRWEKEYNTLATPVSWLYSPLTKGMNDIQSPSNWQLVGATLSLICCAPQGTISSRMLTNCTPSLNQKADLRLTVVML